MKYLIVNADDFGASRGISRGVIEAHECGILTSTSLMVDMPASEAAALAARSLPALSVGLHVALTEETGVPAVDLDDELLCRHELDRQIDRFEQLLERPPSHLDSHHNIHRDARLTRLFLDLAQAYGTPLREHSAVRYFPDFYGQWGGETHLEQVSVENLKRMLSTALETGFTELSCHPGYVDEGFRSVYSLEREAELRTLCDPALRDFLDERKIKLTNYFEFAAEMALAGKKNGY